MDGKQIMEGVIDTGITVEPWPLTEVQYGSIWRATPQSLMLENRIRSLGFDPRDRNHWYNSHRFQFNGNSLRWHLDGPTKRTYGADMFVMICGPNGSGTEIAGPCAEGNPLQRIGDSFARKQDIYHCVFQLETWRLYWIAGNIIHRAPSGFEYTLRELYRWQTKEVEGQEVRKRLIYDNLRPTRRDMEGNIIYFTGRND